MWVIQDNAPTTKLSVIFGDNLHSKISLVIQASSVNACLSTSATVPPLCALRSNNNACHLDSNIHRPLLLLSSKNGSKPDFLETISTINGWCLFRVRTNNGSFLCCQLWRNIHEITAPGSHLKNQSSAQIRPFLDLERISCNHSLMHHLAKS